MHVNQYWHADVTILRTLDGIKQYIYLVSDRYSKKIISYQVSSTLNGYLRTQTFKDAVTHALTTFGVVPQIQLVVDAGTENENNEVNN